ncbi:chemotaxis protein CheD [Pacificoceanicola onchidii]|uniref:chemotaxis protein CheD n=1 Tax=Pacificoceanicola onchidii TaxID=2562685 RepID=UPI0010A4EB23|nr:chemotaxis protein CheD [Pacificoceanicola onchidii]
MTEMRERLVNVIQGDFMISDDPEVVLTTVLGSCIAVCLYDPEKQVGGMNHFLLPEGEGSDTSDVRYGANAMELLINGLLKAGADRDLLEAKIFGGAKMMGNLRNIGESNAVFAHQFLRDESIPCIAESVGGTAARRIRFWPTTGLVRQLTVQGKLDQVAPARPIQDRAKTKDDIVLF